MKPISLDLRQRIVSAYEHGEGSQAQIAQRFEVATTTVERLLKQYRETGSLEPRKQGAPPPLVVSEEERACVKAWIEAQPDLTQDQLRERFEEETGRRVSRRTMGRVRTRLGLTRKKSP